MCIDCHIRFLSDENTLYNQLNEEMPSSMNKTCYITYYYSIYWIQR